MDGLRHTSQHFAEFFGGPDRFAKHAAGELNYVNQIHGNTVKTIYKKRHVEWAITPDLVDKLREVRDLYWHRISQQSAAALSFNSAT